MQENIISNNKDCKSTIVDDNMVDISKEEYKECKNALDVYHELCDLISYVKDGCFSVQYGCIASQNIPTDCSAEQLNAWLEMFFKYSVSAIEQLYKLKKNVFGKSSEKATNQDTFCDDYLEQLRSGKKIQTLPTEKQYNEVLQKVRESIRQIHDQNKAYSEQGEEILNECNKSLLQLNQLRKLEEKIVKNGYRSTEDTVASEDDENKNSSSSTLVSEDGENENSSSSTLVSEDASTLTPDNHEDDNTLSVENEEEIKNNIANAKQDKKEFIKNKNKTREDQLSFLNSLIKDMPKGNTVLPNKVKTVNNPITGEETAAWYSATEERMNKLINVTFRIVQDVVNAIFPIRTKEGAYFEISAATCPDVVLRDDDTGTISHLNCRQILPEDTEEVTEQKEENCLYPYSRQFLAIVYLDENNVLIYSPIEHYGAAGYILGMRAAFVRFGLTENTIICIFVNFFEFLTSKSMVAKWLNDITGKNYTRQYIIKIIIGISRVFDGLFEATVEYALNNANNIHCDETKYRCINVSGSCYMWVAVSGKHDPEPFCIFFAAKGRGYEQFLAMFGITKNENGEFECNSQDELSIKGIVTDGHSAYPKGIDILKKYVRDILYHGVCMVHVRREFLAALDSFGVLKIYHKAVRASHNQTFKDVFEQYLQDEHLTNLEPMVYTIVHLTYLIDLILGLDTDFICKNADEIMNRRLEYSQPLLDEFFSIIDNIVTNNKAYFVEHQTTYEGTTTISYSCGASFRYIKAIVYALNHRTTMYSFLYDGDIETHNNIAESTIRKCVRQRDNMLFLHSDSGFEAYAKAITLMVICDMLGINKYHYFQWALDCAKKELHENRFNTPDRGSSKDAYCFPNAQKDKEGNKIGVYDANYKCAFDQVRWNRYIPYKYQRQLEKELAIARQIKEEKAKFQKPPS